MRNNKGQALIEFVLILPVLLIVIISIVDLGNIMLKKYALESDLDIVSDLYKNNEDYNSYLSKKEITIKTTDIGEYTTIELNKNIKVISPVLVPIYGSNYKISVEKSVINE